MNNMITSTFKHIYTSTCCPNIVLKVARTAERDHHLLSESRAIRTLCNRSAGLLDDRIPWTGTPFTVRLRAPGSSQTEYVVAVVHERLPRGFGYKPRDGARVSLMLSRLQRRSAAEEPSHVLTTARDLLRWAKFVERSPIEDLQLWAANASGALYLSDPEDAGPLVAPRDAARIRGVRRPAAVSAARLQSWNASRNDYYYLPRRQAYVGRRQQVELLTRALIVLLSQNGHSTALHSLRCHALSCDLGCAMSSAPPSDVSAALAGTSAEADEVLRLVGRVFGSSSNSSSSAGVGGGAGGVGGVGDIEPKSSCGACAIGAPDALGKPASAAARRHECVLESGEVHHLRNELPLTCMAEAYGHGTWLAEAIEPAGRPALDARIQHCAFDMHSEECACADQGLLGYCNHSSNCRAHLSALTVAYRSASSEHRFRQKADRSTGHKDKLGGLLERWFGDLVESSVRPRQTQRLRH